jgi:hypothetical protein
MKCFNKGTKSAKIGLKGGKSGGNKASAQRKEAKRYRKLAASGRD